MPSTTLDAGRITRAIASGDTGAFAELYGARFDRCYAIARRSTGLCEADCLDIVQEAFLKITRSIRPIDSEAALDAWLARVVRSCAWDHLRRERRLRNRQGAAARERPGPGSPGEIDGRLAALRKELSGLDQVSRELLELRYRAGMTLTAIGRVVGLKPGAVDGRISRAEAALRTRLEEAADDA
jgi:RNA polymerase sigma-70 factor (ECF subfamily)